MTPPPPGRLLVLPASDPEAIAYAAERLTAGGLVAIPTDTVYGIAASLSVPAAMQRVYDIKGRAAAKPLPVLVAQAEDAESLVRAGSADLLALAGAFWPGPLTVVLPAADDLPPEVVGIDRHGVPTVGVRVPDDDRARALIAAAGGALAVTSANRSGEREARSAAEVAAACPEVEVVLNGGPSRGDRPSTVVAAPGGELQVLREGAIPGRTLAARWREIVGRP